MIKRADCLPQYAPEEERFNAVSHGVGAALACVGLGALLSLAAFYGDARAMAASAVYGLSVPDGDNVPRPASTGKLYFLNL